MFAADELLRVAQSRQGVSVAAILGGSVFVVGFLTAALAHDDSGQYQFLLQQGGGGGGSYADRETPLRGTQAPDLVVRRASPRYEAEGDGAARHRPGRRVAGRYEGRQPRWSADHPGSKRMIAERPAAGPRSLHQPAPQVASVPVPPERPGAQPKITLLDDKTLRRGDVVMLDQGLRVFAGSRNFPYTVSDFERVDAAHGISKEYRKILLDIAHNYDRELASNGSTAASANGPVTITMAKRG